MAKRGLEPISLTTNPKLAEKQFKTTQTLVGGTIAGADVFRMYSSIARLTQSGDQKKWALSWAEVYKRPRAPCNQPRIPSNQSSGTVAFLSSLRARCHWARAVAPSAHKCGQPGQVVRECKNAAVRPACGKCSKCHPDQVPCVSPVRPGHGAAGNRS